MDDPDIEDTHIIDPDPAEEVFVADNEKPTVVSKPKAKKSPTPVEIMNSYGITSIWHMTHKDNASGILRSGILSHGDAHREIDPIDISNTDVQKWRRQPDPIHGRPIHNYAPTYFNIRNPMLYAKKDIKDDLCLIELSLSVLLEHEFIFTDGNAASRGTKFYHKAKDFSELPWDVLKANYWADLDDGKRKRCSEMLFYPKIHPKHIVALHCCSSSTHCELSKLPVTVSFSKKLFF